MKAGFQFFILTSALLSVNFASSQVGISDNGPISPDSKSLMELSSQSRGLLLPRLTTVQMTSIVEAPDGLLIYNTDSSRFYFYSVKAEGWQGLVPGADTLRHICGNPFYDPRDGRSYATVKIGTQCWMAENLRASKFINGDPIPNVTDHNAWFLLTSGAFCWYNNDSASHEIPYGKLYNHYAVSDSRGLCPKRWHVSSELEWITLITYLGGESVAGGKLKEAGTAHWLVPNTDATNESGFTALPAGLKIPVPPFADLGKYTYLWTSDSYSPNEARTRQLSYISAQATWHDYDMNHGWSVRCVKDE
jgi:uncharacterized protein (TIGR02145 family)